MTQFKSYLDNEIEALQAGTPGNLHRCRFDSGNNGNGFDVPSGGGTSTPAPWVPRPGFSATGLVDLIDPTIPKVMADGVYAVTAWLGPENAPTVQHRGRLELSTDYIIEWELNPGMGAGVPVLVGVWFIPQGGMIRASAYQQEGSVMPFYLSGWIQRIA